MGVKLDGYCKDCPFFEPETYVKDDQFFGNRYNQNAKIRTYVNEHIKKDRLTIQQVHDCRKS